MPLNMAIEVFRWKLLASTARLLSNSEAWRSYFAGIALSLITPNRIGEYPGRILYLKQKNTIRLISVSILGAFAQLIALFLYGVAGLIYYNSFFPGHWQMLVLIICCAALLLMLLLFFRFEQWIAYFEQVKWFRRIRTYGQLIRRFSFREQTVVLGLSVLRIAVYLLQLLLLLQWMEISLLSISGFFMAALYFWSVSVIPSIAFAELGVRGHVSIFLFHHLTQNTVGILAATFGLWCINLLVPALVGCILLWRVKFFR